MLDRFSAILRRGRESRNTGRQHFHIHLPFASDGDTHAFIRNALGGDVVPTRHRLPRTPHLPARQRMRAGEGIRLEARLLIEEESKCLHHHRLIQGLPFAP
jgi:hypothetical protein